MGLLQKVSGETDLTSSAKGTVTVLGQPMQQGEQLSPGLEFSAWLKGEAFLQ